ncbi:hypothetical protein GKA01_04030 [Gluconobacter kanchanaburiensis NBRC 103587]|uniref:Transposase n=1 Tax=Gluconobacter kanchanaburiensis NBRC 103587 TaxID=1307948 RepID=A0A511B442_9PROT|nr:transposase [Gluconobacter kanchanaburiensis NBRC 103587]GEK95206.1 hypothetical protein GKA01_04030 [Gluconobacter kanchanaburiensis NBRC 103587]
MTRWIVCGRFSKSHGKSSVDDRRALNGIIFVNRNGLMRPGIRPPQDALQQLETLGRHGHIFMRMMGGLAAEKTEPQTIMIDATYLKAHRTASSLRLKKRIQAA